MLQMCLQTRLLQSVTFHIGLHEWAYWWVGYQMGYQIFWAMGLSLHTFSAPELRYMYKDDLKYYNFENTFYISMVILKHFI